MEVKEVRYLSLIDLTNNCIVDSKKYYTFT